MAEQSKAKSWRQSEFYPYGLMPESAQPGDERPPDWRGDDGHYTRWRERMLRLISDAIWPRIDLARREWRGLAVDQMDTLTKQDLRIIAEIRQPDPDRLIDSLPDSSVRSLACLTHNEFYQSEDDQPVNGGKPLAFSECFALYDRTGDSHVVGRSLEGLFWRGITRKSPTQMIYWFKNKLQRPRPYQAGLVMGVRFSHEKAQTGLHPSIISGHALQGLCGLIRAAERLTLDDAPLDDAPWKIVEQFCVDYGDRRVMAGVHYPSDNLASWIVALDLAEHTVHPDAREQVQRRVWEAITERSLVFRKITALADQDKKPFANALEELAKRDPNRKAVGVKATA